MCEKIIKDRELKRSFVSIFMSLPRAYEDPHEPGGLGWGRRLCQIPPIENPSSTTDSSIGGRAFLPHPPWSLTETNNGMWIR